MSKPRPASTLGGKVVHANATPIGFVMLEVDTAACSFSLSGFMIDAPPRRPFGDSKRAVRIEFDSNVRELAWSFKALEPIVNVHPGEVRQVEFEVINTTAHALTGQAIPSFGPAYAGQYFKKMECFCFAQQTLAAGETRRMPVVFVVDPSAPADLATITLSYTFFPIEGGKS